MSNPNDIVGHKTFADGPLSFRHEPLTRAEAEAIFVEIDREQKERAELMPDEQSAINAMQNAWIRLKELGWREGVYCPKDNSEFLSIQLGSTGIFPTRCHGEWPNCYWDTYDGGDVWPSTQAPALFKVKNG